MTSIVFFNKQQQKEILEEIKGKYDFITDDMSFDEAVYRMNLHEYEKKHAAKENLTKENLERKKEQ